MRSAPLALATLALVSSLAAPRPAGACACAPRSGEPAVNADQTVVLVWDPATKTEHFVRRASFKAEGSDFGFLVPSPTKPDLDESGDAAFATLAKLTAPEIVHERRPSEACSGGCTRGSKAIAASAAPPPQVTVLEEKTVAGFHASVLEASSTSALTGWLGEHGYAFSPAVAAWAKPYVDQGWKITALRVARDPGAARPSEPPGPPGSPGAPGSPGPSGASTVSAASLRMSFKTDLPLFPYREPDSAADASKLAANGRMLRIFFVSNERYEGTLGAGNPPWEANTAFSRVLAPADRDRVLADLRLPAGSYPDTWRLTELEHFWPYRLAPADVTFVPAKDQGTVKRPPIVEYTLADPAGQLRGGLAAALGLVVVPFVRRRRRPA